MYSFFVAIIVIFSIFMSVITYAELKENHPKILHWIMNVAAFVGIWFLVHSYIEVRNKKAKEAVETSIRKEKRRTNENR